MTAPYTPQYIGLDKRINRTFLDMTRSMLKEKNMHHTLWEEVISTSPYVLNRCPTKKLEENIPFKRWARDKKSVSYFRVFG